MSTIMIEPHPIECERPLHTSGVHMRNTEEEAQALAEALRDQGMAVKVSDIGGRKQVSFETRSALATTKSGG